MFKGIVGAVSAPACREDAPWALAVAHGPEVDRHGLSSAWPVQLQCLVALWEMCLGCTVFKTWSFSPPEATASSEKRPVRHPPRLLPAAAEPHLAGPAAQQDRSAAPWGGLSQARGHTLVRPWPFPFVCLTARRLLSSFPWLKLEFRIELLRSIFEAGQEE